ncbi:NADP-dependent isocitrate dehydrogenase [Arthrobacter crystallopoietes]|uniref:NADP-dependent isocitrate dehydrogenase n=1 Tax=Crystallibacter crystallopoietes TaxID=37928 RepID=UPI001ABE1328|nr:NADP-dependent isocitrate dehydrogenase [Arthrobacter crystallopoietes]QTG81608.1 NADP-dependent isocitrate dehydrogenase [Arthrobacter crystallopoietes]
MEKIQTEGTVVELDGDEMAHRMWTLVKERLILPHVDAPILRFDLSLPNRERTGDAVTHDAAAAVAEHLVGVKCATITPDAGRAVEYGLTRLWPSPNGTLRNALNGVLFREPIMIGSVPRLVPGWRKPIVIGRHAHADQYKAVNFAAPGAGRLTLTYTPDDGSPAISHEVTSFPSGGGVAMGMYNYTDSIRDFARACFSYGLKRGYPVYLSTKNTVLKAYDGQFKDVFGQVYDGEFRTAFEAAGIGYEHRLIDDMVASALRWEGGYLWACKNYDGDVQSDIVAQGFGSPGLMTSVLTTPEGRTQLTEAAHGTIARHHRRRLAGETTSTNPIATIYAWTRALAHRAMLDGNVALAGFASGLEEAVVKTVDRGILTADLASLSEPGASGVTTEAFLDAVAVTVADAKTSA